MDNSMRPITAEMEAWLAVDVRAAHRQWRTFLNGLASYERDVLADPEAWAPIILRDLQERAERQRRRLLDYYGLDPDSEHQGNGFSRRLRNWAEREAFLRTFLEYEMSRSTLDAIETNVARLPEKGHAREICECYLASNYAIPALSIILGETLADQLDSRSARQAASETLAAYLAGYFACKISLNTAKRLKWLLCMEGGSPFQNLLRHLPLEALGVWAEADPLRERMDDLAKKAAEAVEAHLKAERVISTGANAADGPDEAAEEDFGVFGAREATREEVAAEKVARYRVAREKAKLSPREIEALDLRESGLKQTEIAARMGIAEGTVKHRATLLPLTTHPLTNCY